MMKQNKNCICMLIEHDPNGYSFEYKNDRSNLVKEKKI